METNDVHGVCGQLWSGELARGLGNYNSLAFIDVSIKVQPIHLECVVILSY